ncbi:hypothetical protein NCS57_00210200 [Fusarium keratoplasticum]|uniref:Uncharacterized protein n=1 Tax=Fusarium keratoplasticum TaxID=1328300 RepID=A0ACC0R8P7_9HYPO|nr:hypothetical protein NCS57_00210200 [Fusarium keratoplasticum]KAI8679325.1 hypothetical protein NCS57_00210200 [Fusarium keratoplasticum]
MSVLNPSSVNQVDMSAAKPSVNAADAELWHAYLRAISDYFPFSEQPDGYRIYTAPLTSFGVTIGRAVDQSIVNNDIFRLGDLLLPPDSPIFLPRLSYSQRLRRYLQFVTTPPGRQNADTLARLEKTKEKLTEATNDFIKCRHQAYGAYLADPAYIKPPAGASTTAESQVQFNSWAKTFYPSYQLASLHKDAASQEAYEAHLEYYGPQTASLWNDRVQLDHAFVANSLNKPYNMPTSTGQVTLDEIVGSGSPPAPLDITYQPRYNIDDKFSEMALSWVLNAKNGNNKPLEITVRSSSVSPAKPADWNDLGFSKISLAKHDEILARVPLFTAHTHEASTPTNQPNLQVGLEDKRTSVEVTIQASDAAVFTLGPDQSWDIPDMTTRYPRLRAEAPGDLYQPLVLVTHVFLGYQVSVTMTLDENTFEKIDQGINKCQDHGGTASLFGLSVGPRSTDSMVGFEQIKRDPSINTIHIPPRDNSQLTIIGLMGMELPAPKPAKTPTDPAPL